MFLPAPKHKTPPSSLSGEWVHLYLEVDGTVQPVPALITHEYPPVERRVAPADGGGPPAKVLRHHIDATAFPPRQLPRPVSCDLEDHVDLAALGR